MTCAPWPREPPDGPGYAIGRPGGEGPYADVDTIDEADGGGARLAWLWGEQGLAGEYLLARRTMTVGRDPGSDIVLSDPTVSREHARIAYEDGRWWLLPADTASHSWVNGRPVAPGQRVPVGHGDRLRFGFHTQLRLLVPGARGA